MIPDSVKLYIIRSYLSKNKDILYNHNDSKSRCIAFFIIIYLDLHLLVLNN